MEENIHLLGRCGIAAVASDFNSDGKLDLVVADSGGIVILPGRP
jgi:hypothetical protein